MRQLIEADERNLRALLPMCRTASSGARNICLHPRQRMQLSTDATLSKIVKGKEFRKCDDGTKHLRDRLSHDILE
jgi:hypothetical protein